MGSSTRNILELLPNKLIVNILSMLHDRDLASSIQVCKRMVDIIGGSALLQYRLELRRSGLQDGPRNTLSILERMERLRAYTDAWKDLRWSTCIELPNIDVVTHDMDIAPGGILTFRSKRESKIIFAQIPSNLRDIPMRQWEHSFSFHPHQYALDPSEDILVVLEWDNDESHFHFLSLTTGENHPLVAIPLLSSSHNLISSSVVENFRLSVAQNYLAILDRMYELCVWNWKTGQKLLSISSGDIHTVSFLPENRLLLATTRVGDVVDDVILSKYGYGNRPVLVVYDLDPASTSQHERVSSPIAVFTLELEDEGDLCGMELYSRPDIQPNWGKVAVPFFRSPSDQLIGLQANLSWNHTILTRILLIPIVTLTSHIADPAANDVPLRVIPWDYWGAMGTRWASGLFDSCHFRGSLSGSRFILDPKQPKFVEVWDFSCALVAQLESQQSDGEVLPCVQTQVALPMQLAGHTPMAISEDALICQHHYETKTYILVF